MSPPLSRNAALAASASNFQVFGSLLGLTILRLTLLGDEADDVADLSVGFPINKPRSVCGQNVIGVNAIAMNEQGVESHYRDTEAEACRPDGKKQLLRSGSIGTAEIEYDINGELQSFCTVIGRFTSGGSRHNDGSSMNTDFMVFDSTSTSNEANSDITPGLRQ